MLSPSPSPARLVNHAVIVEGRQVGLQAPASGEYHEPHCQQKTEGFHEMEIAKLVAYSVAYNGLQPHTILSLAAQECPAKSSRWRMSTSREAPR